MKTAKNKTQHIGKILIAIALIFLAFSVASAMNLYVNSVTASNIPRTGTQTNFYVTISTDSSSTLGAPFRVYYKFSTSYIANFQPTDSYFEVSGISNVNSYLKSISFTPPSTGHYYLHILINPCDMSGYGGQSLCSLWCCDELVGSPCTGCVSGKEIPYYIESTYGDNLHHHLFYISPPCSSDGWSISLSPSPGLINSTITATINYNKAGHDCLGEKLKITKDSGGTGTEVGTTGIGETPGNGIMQMASVNSEHKTETTTKKENTLSFSTNPEEIILSESCISCSSETFVYAGANTKCCFTSENTQSLNNWYYLHVTSRNYINVVNTPINFTRCLGNINLTLIPNPVTNAPKTVTADVVMGSGFNVLNSITAKSCADLSSAWIPMWDYLAMSFVQSSTKALQAVSLPIKRGDDCLKQGGFNVGIYSNYEGSYYPNMSNQLAYITISGENALPASTPVTSTDFVYVPFTQHPILGDGVRYWIVVDSNIGCGGTSFLWDTYGRVISGGTCVSNHCNWHKSAHWTGWWSMSTTCRRFKVHTFEPGQCRYSETFELRNDSGYIASSTIPAGGFIKNTTFSSPSLTGLYNYWAVINKTSTDGSYSHVGERDDDALAVNICHGTFTWSIAPTTVCYPGSVNVTLSATGLNEHCLGDYIRVRYTHRPNPSIASFGPITGTTFSEQTKSYPINVDNSYFRPSGTYFVDGEWKVFNSPYNFRPHVDSWLDPQRSFSVVHTLKVRDGNLDSVACENICYDFQGTPICCESQIRVFADILNTGEVPEGLNVTLNITPISEYCPECEDIFFWQTVYGSGELYPSFGFEDIHYGSNCSYNITLDIGINRLTALGFGGDCLKLSHTFYAPCVKYEPFKKWKNVSLMSLPMHINYALKYNTNNANYLSQITNSPDCSEENNRLYPSGNVYCCDTNSPACSCLTCNQEASNVHWCPLPNMKTPWRWLFGEGLLDWANIGNAQGFYTDRNVGTGTKPQCNQPGVYAYPRVYSSNILPASIDQKGGCIEGIKCNYDEYLVTRHKYSWDIEYDMSVNTYSKDEFVPVYVGNDMILSVPSSNDFEQISSEVCSGDGNLCYTELSMCGDGICDIRSGERCWNCPEDCGCSDDKFCTLCNMPGFTDSKGCASEYRQRGEECTCEQGQCATGLSCIGIVDGVGHCCYDGTQACDPAVHGECAAETWNEELEKCYVKRSIGITEMSIDVRPVSETDSSEYCSGCDFASPGRQTVADLGFKICNEGDIDETVNISVEILPKNIFRLFDAFAYSVVCTVNNGRVVCDDLRMHALESGLTSYIDYYNVKIPKNTCLYLENLEGEYLDESKVGRGMFGKKELIKCVHPNNEHPYGLGITAHTSLLSQDDANLLCQAINDFGGSSTGLLDYTDTTMEYCFGCIPNKRCTFKASLVQICNTWDQTCTESAVGYGLPYLGTPSATYYQTFRKTDGSFEETMGTGTVVRISLNISSDKMINGELGNAPESIVGGQLTNYGDTSVTNIWCDTMNSLHMYGTARPQESSSDLSEGHLCMTDYVSGQGAFKGSGFWGTEYDKSFGPFYGISEGTCDIISSCTTGDEIKYTCPDGTQIALYECMGGIWKKQNNYCDECEAGETIEETCHDGTRLVFSQCINGRWVKRVFGPSTNLINPDGSTGGYMHEIDLFHNTCPPEPEFEPGIYPIEHHPEGSLRAGEIKSWNECFDLRYTYVDCFNDPDMCETYDVLEVDTVYCLPFQSSDECLEGQTEVLEYCPAGQINTIGSNVKRSKRCCVGEGYCGQVPPPLTPLGQKTGFYWQGIGYFCYST